MNKKFITIVTLILALLFASMSVMAQDSFNAARKALGSKNYDAAIRHADATINEYPEWFWGYYVKGMAEMGKNKYSNAAVSFGKAYSVSAEQDDMFRASFQTADAYYRLGNWSKCRTMIAQSRKNSASKHHNAQSKDRLRTWEGWCFYNTKNYKNAITSFKPFVDSGKASANILKAVATSYLETKQTNNAIAVISQAVKKDPKDLAAHKILVKSYNNAKKYSQAVQAADFAVQTHDRDWELYYLKGSAHKHLNQNSSAVAALSRSITISSQPKVIRLLGETYMAQSNWRDATAKLSQAQSTFAGDWKLYYDMAYCYNEMVPKDTEKYKGKPEAGNFNQALGNAESTANNANTLAGVDKALVNQILMAVAQKKKRLLDGETYTQEVERRLDPETGEIIEVVIDPKKDKDK
jgi:tetratricopeptide (TPR) repeat protein